MYGSGSSRVKTRRGVSGPKINLVCEPDVSGNKEDAGPSVFPWTCCESLEVKGPHDVHKVHSRSAMKRDMSGSHSRSISDPIRSS